MPSGKARRLARLVGPDGKTLLIAIDHVVSSGRLGPVGDARGLLAAVVAGSADGIVAHRGAATRLVPVQRETALIVHLSGNTSLSAGSDLKARVCSPDAALAQGADAVSVHITLGAGHVEDRAALASLGEVSDRCADLGLPLLAMTQVRAAGERRSAAILHAARVAMELGADVVKAADPGEEHLSELVETAVVPVVLAGGEASSSWPDYLCAATTAMRHGIAGFCVGRRVFAHPDPQRAVAELGLVAHGPVDADQPGELRTETYRAA